MNTKDTVDAKQKKIIKTKQSFYWNFAFDYLQTLREFTELIEDKVFFELYDKLIDYVDDKIALPNEGNVKDVYVVVEYEVSVE